MQRLANGDPLEIGPRAEAVLDEAGMLLDPARVYARALARVAYAACAQGPPRDLGPWLRAQIDRSAAELLEEDREAEHADLAMPQSQTCYSALILAFGVELRFARRLSVVFHDLPLLQRRIVSAIVKEGCSLRELSGRLGRPVTEIDTELRAAVESLEAAAGTRLAGRLGGGRHD